MISDCEFINGRPTGDRSPRTAHHACHSLCSKEPFHCPQLRPCPAGVPRSPAEPRAADRLSGSLSYPGVHQHEAVWQSCAPPPPEGPRHSPPEAKASPCQPSQEGSHLMWFIRTAKTCLSRGEAGCKEDLRTALCVLASRSHHPGPDSGGYCGCEFSSHPVRVWDGLLTRISPQSQVNLNEMVSAFLPLALRKARRGTQGTWSTDVHIHHCPQPPADRDRGRVESKPALHAAGGRLP